MIKKYIKFFIFACICFIIADCFVKADTVKFNGTTMGSNNYVVMPSGNRTITFNGTAVYGDIADFPQYYLLTVCADNDKISSWSINNSTLSTVNIYDTSYNCSFPNSSYTGGHIVYIYGSYNPSTACNSSLMNCYQNGSFTLNNPSSSSWALLSYQNSTDNISIDYASNSIISQNNDIINQQQQIINQNNTINNTINDTFNNCEYNLFNQYDITEGYFINSNGDLTSSTGWFVSNYIRVEPGTTYTYSNTSAGSSPYSAYYDSSKRFQSTFKQSAGTNNSLTIPAGSYYVRFSIPKNNLSTFTFFDPNNCVNSLDDTNNKLNEVNSSINGVNDTLNDDDVDSDSASSFFDDFTVNDNGGISSIVSAPLVAIEQMLSGTCSPMTATWHGKEISLPCGTDFWNRISAIRSFLNVTLGGLLCYRIILKIFKLVEGFKNPENDKVEVMNL